MSEVYTLVYTEENVLYSNVFSSSDFDDLNEVEPARERCLEAVLDELKRTSAYRYRDRDNYTQYRGELNMVIFKDGMEVCKVEFDSGDTMDDRWDGKILSVYKFYGEEIADELSAKYNEWFTEKRAEVEKKILARQVEKELARREKELARLEELKRKYEQ